MFQMSFNGTALWVTKRRPIECFHSRGQHLCKFIETKESVYMKKEFNSLRTGLGHQHGRRFIVLGHKYGRRDVMWKHSIVCLNSWQFKTENIRGLGKIKTEIKWQKITWWIYFIHFCKVFTSCSLTICKLEWRASYGLKLQQILPGAGDFVSEF